MKKKLLATMLSMCMILSLMPGSAFAAEASAEQPEGAVTAQAPAGQSEEAVTSPQVREVATAEELKAAANEGGKVRLLNTINDLDPIEITNGKTLDLDLNGFDLNFKTAKAFVVNNGTLNLDGAGVITAQFVGQYNSALELTGSAEDVADYSVVTIGENVTVKSNGSYGGAIFCAEGTNRAYGAKLVVNGRFESTYGFSINGLVTEISGTNLPEVVVNPTGVITGSSAIYGAGYGKYIVKGTLAGDGEFGIEVRAGKLEIHDTAKISCTAPFSDPAPNGNGSTVQGAAIAVSQHETNLPINVQIMGGTISETGENGYALYEIDTAEVESAENVAKDVSISITGGNFSGNVYSTNQKCAISGGYFTSDPTPYLEEGKAALVSDEDGYNFMVGEKPELAAEVAPAAPEVEAPVLEDASEADQALADAFTDAMTDDTLTVTGDSLDLAARGLANKNKVTAENGAKQLNAVVSNATAENTKIVVQHYVKVQVTDAEADEGGSKTLSVEVTPMAQTVAVKDYTDDVTIQTEGEDQNAVKMGHPVELTVDGPVTVIITLPAGFTVDDTVHVRHDKGGCHYIYEGTVTENILTFVSEHGLSPFTIGVAAPAAKIGNTGYATLGEAVDAVKSGETIVLTLNNTETVTVSRPVKFTLNTNGKTFTGSITASGNYRNDGTDDRYDFVYVAPSTPVTPVTPPVKPDKCDGGVNCPTVHLLDVDKNAWYHNAVDYAVSKHLMTGTSAITFDPQRTTSRGMIVTILYNLEGRPAVTAPNPFKDVADGIWYTDAIRWAAANGIVAGYDSTTFAPDAPVTREQLAVILYHYAAHKGHDVTSAAYLGAYSDADQISSWAMRAMQWANAKGLISGTTAVTIAPQLTADRAQTASILRSFCENVAK